MPFQTPLPFEFNPNQDFSSYHNGPNTQAVLALKSCASGERTDYVFVWGESGVGKTHLLQACCQIAAQSELLTAYIPLKSVIGFNPAILDGLENLNLVCIDDIQRAAGDKAWELGLFNFFNRVRETGNALIISGLGPPARSGIGLPDLKSRLAWGLTIKLQVPNDDDKLAALMLRAENLGFMLPTHVGRYLLRHYPRDLPSLWTILRTLDTATLAAKRRLTIPFVKQYLE